MWSSYFPFHFPFSHKVKSAEVGVALEKAHTHTLSPGKEVRFAPQRSVGLRAPPRPLGAAQPSSPAPAVGGGGADEKGLRAVLAGGGGGGCSERQALRAQHSTVRRHPLPQPAAACSPLLPEASPAPSTPSRPSANPLPSAQPMASQGASRATRQAANWGGPPGGQPPGIGQLRTAPAPARLLFVRAAPISPGYHPKARSQASHSWAR